MIYSHNVHMYVHVFTNILLQYIDWKLKLIGNIKQMDFDDRSAVSKIASILNRFR